MILRFEKMHGLGNDYVIIDERSETLVPEDHKSNFARTLCDRGFGVGADGLLYIGPHEDADIQMRIINADGSEAESCGNGLRCAAFFHHGVDKPGYSEMSIDLPLSETVSAEVQHEGGNTSSVRLQLPQAGQYVDARRVELEDMTLDYHRIDVGNPHAVIFLDENESRLPELDKIDLTEIGPQIQNHPDFEDTGGINAEFVQQIDDNTTKMRVHERGVGETRSCGTGCIAIAQACASLGRGQGWISVEQPGGELRIETEKGFLEGPAEHSYTGYRTVQNGSTINMNQ